MTPAEMNAKLEKKEQVKVDEENEARLARCVPIAKAAIKIIIDSDPFIGDMTPEQGMEKYQKVASDIVGMMQLAGTKYTERHFVFQLMAQIIDTPGTIVNASLEKAFEYASKKLFTKDMMDLTLDDIDKVLKTE